MTDDRLVRAFVQDVLLYNLSVARAESAQDRPGHSGIVPVLSAVELGCVGNGCHGTKALVAVSADPELRRRVEPDPIGTLRYHALLGRDLQTAEAIVFDGKADEIADVTFGARVIPCTLAQRVGFHIAEATDRKRYDRWLGKIAAKDSKPALNDAETLGNECLQSAAKAWFAVE